jgi:PEGA domain
MTESISLKAMFVRVAIAGAAAMILVFLTAQSAYSQAAAESATATAQSGSAAAAAAAPPAAPADAATSAAGAGVTATTDAKKPGPVTLATPVAPSSGGSSPHLIAHDGPPAEEVNRKELEEHAGRDAGKLLLRSTPPGAQIFINGSVVGHTPLLIMVAPGKYTVEMRGGRDDVAQRIVGLMANETQEITLKLASPYRANITTK